jgi:aspartyl-tRNA(Asn)/glutamyl-tRNA(Gln) amidotransferase subunit B
MKDRLVAQHGLTPYEAATLTAERALARYFEDALATLGGHPKLVAGWVLNEVAAALNREGLHIEDSKVDAQRLAGLLARVTDNTISGKMAKEVFDAMWAGEGAADAIIERRGLRQISDEGAIAALIETVVAANPAIVAQYRAGKEKAFHALVGKVMAASRGKANPAQVNALLKRKLE